MSPGLLGMPQKDTRRDLNRCIQDSTCIISYSHSNKYQPKSKKCPNITLASSLERRGHPVVHPATTKNTMNTEMVGLPRLTISKGLITLIKELFHQNMAMF